MHLEISNKSSLRPDWQELWSYRELFYFLMWRDIKVRYSQTILGVLWVLIQPLSTMLIFSLFFGKFSQLPSEGFSYPVFVLSALLPWFFFSNGFTFGANSLISEGNLIKKVYFPRIFLPLSKVSVGLLDFAIGLPVLFVFMWIYEIPFTIRLFVLPLGMAFLYITTIGFSFLFSALSLLFRDIKHTVPFLVQLWLFVSPVVYSSSVVPDKWKIVYALNPMTGVIESFRWMVLGQSPLTLGMLMTSLIVSIGILVVGYLYFCSTEEHFADIV